MEEKATVRISWVGSCRLAPPETCDVCHADVPIVIMENLQTERKAWICKGCFEKGYPVHYKEMKNWRELEIDAKTMPDWAKEIENVGG